MKKIMLYPNPTRDQDMRTTRETAQRLTALGADVVLPRELFPELAALDSIRILPLDEVLSGLSLMVALGGDGTLLRCAQLASAAGVPVLGINLGRIGFLTGLEREELSLLDRLFSGGYELDKRMMLLAELLENDQVTQRQSALNDIVLSRGPGGQTIRLSLLVDENPLSDFHGDGLIVATPTGSSGYAMSAGGPVLEPRAQSILVAPICPRASVVRSYVLEADRTLTINPDADEDRVVFLTVDGGPALRITPKCRVRVRRAEVCTDILRIRSQNFFELVNRKLK